MKPTISKLARFFTLIFQRHEKLFKLGEEQSRVTPLDLPCDRNMAIYVLSRSAKRLCCKYWSCVKIVSLSTFQNYVPTAVSMTRGLD